MMEVVALSRAEAQLIELYNQYEDWREGLGDKFDLDYCAACQNLAKYPEIGLRFEGPLRRLMLLKWNVGLFYTVEGNRVLIHGALDVRQSPDRIRQHLGLL